MTAADDASANGRTEAALIEALHDHRLADRAKQLHDADPALVDRVLTTCARIRSELNAEIARLRPILEAAGVPIDGVESIEHAQSHTITFLVPGAAAGEHGQAVLADLGFDLWEQWSGGAAESFRRSADQTTAARTDDVTYVVRFRWRARRRRSRLERALTPTSGDWALVDMPPWAWRVYPIVRVARLLAERSGLRARHRASLGPFLATPESLLDPLFDIADVGPSDVVADIGAGDGRIAIAAAARRGCRSIAVEQRADLIARAHADAAAAGVNERVSVIAGDAATAELSAATVATVFLPIDVVADRFDDLTSTLRPGTRVVVHEQSRLPGTLRPHRSHLVVGDNAFTVAHTWTIGRAAAGPPPAGQASTSTASADDEPSGSSESSTTD